MADRPSSQASTTPTAVDDRGHGHVPDHQDSQNVSEKQSSVRKERPTVAVTHPNSNDTYEPILFYDEPPPLNYTIKTGSRERVIIIWFTLLFVDTTKNLAIITSLIGTVSGFKFAQRMWFLWFIRDHVSRRLIGVGRWGVDFFQYILSLAMAAFFIPLIIGSSVNPGSPRITAMALPCVMLVLTLPLLITGIFPYRVRVPWRVSSFPPRQPLPPLGYCYVEDIVAVDGGGCTQFRQAWRTRYEESQVIRHMVRQLSVLWGVSGLIVAAGVLAACWTASVDTGYGIGYGNPWLWALLMTAVTVVRVHNELARERREWVARMEEAHRARRLRIREGKYDPPALPTTVDEGLRRDLDARRSVDWRDAEGAEHRRTASDGSWWVRSRSGRRGVLSSPTRRMSGGRDGEGVAVPEPTVTRDLRSVSPGITLGGQTSPV
ncbi:uncharacterized protein B0H18DRAFT_1125210 [Fomitopsis serialis]|uniref:uncharacterized protein n=1 Tax=Fomitopsis serialis TaxID=139415 RepID=UPI002007CB91|nr:uncharacterized protein B0H18DRAFT_1125210 [Neoantrodia serialis]KAH9914926.1 hypothetical protein B0H18DRAFT_1125210 [Neoantrodia serialis]